MCFMDGGTAGFETTHVRGGGDTHSHTHSHTHTATHTATHIATHTQPHTATYVGKGRHDCDAVSKNCSANSKGSARPTRTLLGEASTLK